MMTLAMLGIACARGAQLPAKAHHSSAHTTGSHAVRSRVSRRSTSRAKTLSKSKTKIAAQRSPEEVGRTAGIAIRRKLAERRVAQRRRANRAGRAHLERTAASMRVNRPEVTVRAALRDDPAADDAAKDVPVAASRAAEASFHSNAMRMPAPTHVTADSDLSGPAAANRGQAANRSTTQSAIRDETNQDRDDSSAPDDAADDDGADSPPPVKSVARAEDARATDEASLGTLRGGMPAPLRGSLASLERQNARLDAEGLERIEDEDDLAARIANRLLVPVPVSAALTINTDLSANHRYCRPWTARFLADLAKAHEAMFHRPLEVSSAVRTVEYQKHLMLTNGNAAAAEGDVVSPHLTGATIDIAKSGLTRQEIAWMRRRLLALQAANKIDVEEEFQQACFHITVYKTYTPARTTHPATPAHPDTQRHVPHAAPDADDQSEAEGI